HDSHKNSKGNSGNGNGEVQSTTTDDWSCKKLEQEQVLLHPEVKSRMIPATTLTLGFSAEISWPLRQILLMYHRPPASHKNPRSPIHSPRATKFLVGGRIVTLCSNTTTPTECRMAAEALNESLPNEPTMAEGIKVTIYLEYPEQTVTIGESLSEKRKIELYDLLRSKLDIFAWKLLDMTGVPRSIIEHRLNFREGCLPVSKKEEDMHRTRTKLSKKKLLSS
nr:hypothetical protein [Tanacetum cinerariifolium]